MSRHDDRSWMRMDRSSPVWQEKFLKYIQTTFDGTSTALCPCARCRCMVYKTRREVHRHVLCFRFDESFISEGERPSDEGGPSNNLEGSVEDEEGGNDVDRGTDLIGTLIRATIHGNIIQGPDEEPNERAKKFYKLLEEARQELYPGCKEATKVSFIVRLFQIKCMHGISNSALRSILSLFSHVLPEGHCVPNTLEKVQSVVQELGLDYEKIHACENDCVLFWKENEKLDTCPTCGESRWKDDGAAKGVDTSNTGGTPKKRVPRKILRYFPLIPRLQRLYMRETTSSNMRWHKEGLARDGKMRHPADSPAWKHVDDKYNWFSSDPRNVRLALASDGFNPFGMINTTYTTWPVIIIPYNLPPWLCMKQPYWMMSMLVPGPKSPGNNIDVYFRPLIDELKELWKDGVETWDAKEKKNFNLHALLLWTINDFPAYAMLSGWSTKGKFACPYCNKDTDFLWLKYGSKHCYMGHRRLLPSKHRWRRNKISFNNKVEMREAPKPLTGEQVREQFQYFEQVSFGKTTRKRKQREEENRWHNWRKQSIFFELPYWDSLLIRHNLDVMHIEKNICESILGTLLEIDGKCKDSEKARLDMQHLGMRKDQHLVMENNKYTMPPALYTLSRHEKQILCKFLEGVKMPDGFASNIKRCVDVKACKVVGLKTHDYHVILQKLLPLIVRSILPQDVVVPLIDLSRFFNAICSKELVEADLEKLDSSIRETLCRLEMVFPPAFFDIMMHLPVHLGEEAKLGGPVSYRWMYPVERYLRTLKGYVRNKAHPEGSIAEGYISEECLTFCARFLEDVDTKLNQADRHESAAMNEPPSGLSIFSEIDYSKKGFSFEVISREELVKMRHYIITNCEEAGNWVDEHMDELRKDGTTNLDKRHKEQFVNWFQGKIMKQNEEGINCGLLCSLAKGPDHRARVFNRCFINGFLFRTASIETRLTTRNSGVYVKGDASTGNMAWYGVIKKIITLDFPEEKEVVLFQCDWYDVPAATTSKGKGYNKDEYGVIEIDTSRYRYSSDPYILAIQAELVFYAEIPSKPGWCSVVTMKPRNLFAMPEAENEGDIDISLLDVGVQDMNNELRLRMDLTNWRRSDLEGSSGDFSVINQAIAQSVPEPDHAAFLDAEDDEDDETYIDDGVVAPATTVGEGQDDDFFV